MPFALLLPPIWLFAAATRNRQKRYGAIRRATARSSCPQRPLPQPPPSAPATTGCMTKFSASCVLVPLKQKTHGTERFCPCRKRWRRTAWRRRVSRRIGSKPVIFHFFPYELRPFLLYLYAMYLRNTGDYAQMLGVAKAALALNEKPATFTWLDVYLGVLCANASYMLGDTAQAKKYLISALVLGMPCGFIAPFADHLGTFGGTLEAVIEREYPQSRKAVTDLWSSSFKNWMQFHNTFTKEDITTILNQQEYQTARLVTGGATYAQTAQRMNLSVSRVKNILADVYAKLGIQSKQKLADYIL